MNHNRKKRIYNKTNGKCAYCGCPINIKEMTVDHIVPRAAGGSNDISNLNPSCKTCNYMKGSSPLADFLDKTTKIAQKANPHRLNVRIPPVWNTRDLILYYNHFAKTVWEKEENPVYKYELLI